MADSTFVAAAQHSEAATAEIARAEASVPGQQLVRVRVGIGLMSG